MPHTSKPDGALPGETVCDLAPPRLQPSRHQRMKGWGQGRSSVLAGTFLAPLRLQPLGAPRGLPHPSAMAGQRTKDWGQEGCTSVLAGAFAWASALPAPPGIGRGTGIGHGVVDKGQGVQRSCAGCCRSCCTPTAAPENCPTLTPCDSPPSTFAQGAYHCDPASASSGCDMRLWPW